MESYSRTHKIKINNCFLENIISGRKRFEIRKNDRDYQVGDWLNLQASDNGECHKGLMVKIIYISTFMMQDGYCVLGIDWPIQEGNG
jgi:hypothetical protein